MTIDTIIRVLTNIRDEYDGAVDIDTITLLDGDWFAVSGWALDRDGGDVEIDARYNDKGVELFTPIW